MSPSGFPPPDVTSYHSVVKKVAELLGLPLSTKEVKSNLLTDVLHSTPQTPEPLLPFNEALTEPILSVWEKPTSARGCF